MRLKERNEKSVLSNLRWWRDHGGTEIAFWNCTWELKDKENIENPLLKKIVDLQKYCHTNNEMRKLLDQIT